MERLSAAPSRDGAARLLTAATVVLCMVYASAATPLRPSLLPDAAYGLLVHRSMQRGAPWNHVTEPSDENISVDRTYFYAVWSPGQYAIPGALIDAGLTPGRAVAAVATAASIGGLLFWWWLFRRLGHDQLSASGAVAVIAVSRSFNYSFLTYVGSDVLAFAFFPLLAGLLWQKRTSRGLAVYAAAATLVAFVAKNSLPIYVGAWLVAQASVTFPARGGRVPALLSAAIPVASAAATMAVIHAGYNARGWTPVSYEPALSASAASYVLPWAMPLLAATSWDDVFSRMFSHPSAPVVAFDYKAALPLLAVFAGLSAAGVAAAVRRGGEGVRVAAIFSVVAVAVLMLLLATGSGASLDLSRHYRLIGYVWLPWLVVLVRSPRRATALTTVIALAVPGGYGVASFAANWQRHLERNASHSEAVQIVHPQMSPRVVAALTLLDRELPDAALVVTSSPDTALEFLRVRVLPTSAVSESVDRIRRSRRSGTVANLVVIAELPGMPDEQRQALLDSFTAYEEWQSVDVDNHRFYVPVGQLVSAVWLRERLHGTAHSL